MSIFPFSTSISNQPIPHQLYPPFFMAPPQPTPLKTQRLQSGDLCPHTTHLTHREWSSKNINFIGWLPSFLFNASCSSWTETQTLHPGSWVPLTLPLSHSLYVPCSSHSGPLSPFTFQDCWTLRSLVLVLLTGSSLCPWCGWLLGAIQISAWMLSAQIT